jgi:hypothetical protein
LKSDAHARVALEEDQVNEQDLFILEDIAKNFEAKLHVW